MLGRVRSSSSMILRRAWCALRTGAGDVVEDEAQLRAAVPDVEGQLCARRVHQGLRGGQLRCERLRRRSGIHNELLPHLPTMQ